MEKINLVELLKDCPMGMELDCINYYGVVRLNRVMDDNSLYPIEINVVYGDECNVHTLTKYGQTVKTPYNKCIIFPKGKTTWEGFHRPFEPGDIVITNHNEHAFIYSGENDNYWEAYCGVYCGTRDLCINSKQWSDKKHKIRLATEEEKEKLFQVIKDSGYKWNSEIKTLEKLLRFKVGDRIRHKTHIRQGNVVTEVRDTHYILDDELALPFISQDDYELVPNKFDITNLKPFDKVLVRGDVRQKWTHDFFGFMDKSRGYPFVCVGHYVSQCIPFEGNEHLLGNTNDCDPYYKSWINEKD